MVTRIYSLLCVWMQPGPGAFLPVEPKMGGYNSCERQSDIRRASAMEVKQCMHMVLSVLVEHAARWWMGGICVLRPLSSVSSVLGSIVLPQAAVAQSERVPSRSLNVSCTCAQSFSGCILLVLLPATVPCQVFDEIGAAVIDHAFSGYNATVFAYGQVWHSMVASYVALSSCMHLFSCIVSDLHPRPHPSIEMGSSFVARLPYC